MLGTSIVAVIFCSSIVRSTVAGSNPGSTTSRPPFATVGAKNAAPACDSGVQIKKVGASGHSHSASCTWVIAAMLAAVPIDALGLACRSAGVGHAHDVIGGELLRHERLRRIRGCLGCEIVDRDDRRERRNLGLQRLGALQEHRDVVDDEGAGARVRQHVGVVVEGSERVQRGAPVALRLAGPDQEQHLGPVGGQQSDRGSGASAEILQGADVAAHLVGHLLARDAPITQLEHLGVAVPAQ